MTELADIERMLDDGTAMPSFIADAMIPASSITDDIPEQDYLDGHMIPRGACTLLSTAGGSGKTTSGLSAAVNSAYDGTFEFFGCRKHDKPLRCLMVFGEETSKMVARKIVREMGARDRFHKATNDGKLAIISWTEFAGRSHSPEKVFSESGGLTETGKKLFAAIRAWRPDFVMFDTLSSLSDGDYLSDRIAYTTLRELNNLAASTDAGIIMTAHLVKGGAAKITEHSSSDDLIALSRGSAAIVNAARHAAVLVPAPPGAYSNLDLEDRDQLWMCGVKSNLGFAGANTTFAVIRSARQRTFLTTSSGGRQLSEELSERDKKMVKLLEEYLVRLIRLSAERLQPFAESGKMCPEKLYPDLLAPVLPTGATQRQVAQAVDNLIRKQRITVARTSATATGLLDVSGGPFANPELHLDDAGKEPKFRKGAPPIADLIDQVREELELVDLENPRGE
jgi:hypothetical protein